MKTGLRKAKGSADQKLREFLLAYRSTPSYALDGKSPAELMLSRRMKSRLDLLRPSQSPAKARMEERFNFAHGARWKEFAVGDKVWYKLHNIHKNAWEWTPAIVMGRVGEVNYKLQLDSGRAIPKAHAKQLKLRYNEFKDMFELLEVPDDQIEPTIIPTQDIIQQDDSESEVYEDAQEDDIDIQEQPEDPELRRSTRANAGVPPQRYGHSS